MVQSLRFSGLASGLDTQSIVDSLMQAKRIPLDKLNQKKQTIEWKRDDYREMNKLLSEFDKFIFDGVFRQANMLKRTTSSSNQSIVTATATANAGTISYKIEDVKLATAARYQSSASISKADTGKINSTKSLWSQRDKFEELKWQSEENTDKFVVPKDGESTFQLSRGAVSQLNNLTDSDGVKKLEVLKPNGDKEYYNVSFGPIPESNLDSKTVYIDDDSGKIVFGEKLQEKSEFSIVYDRNYLEFNIETYNEDGSVNTKESGFKIDGTSSLDSMFSQVNDSNVGVNLFYDSFTDQVVLQRKATGKLENTNGDSVNFTGLSNGFFTKTLNLEEKNKGENAVFTINGLRTERASNTFSMNGVTFTLHNSSSSGQATTVNVSTDNESIMGTIKEFVEKYNELIGKINGKLTEERYSSFTPLTEEQKSAMSESEIEKWEEKAKSGLLKRDQILDSGLLKFRTDLYTEVISNDVTLTDSKYNQLAEIGITTTNNYMDRGKLQIDEAKLRKAVEENPEAIYQLFMANGSTQSEKGIARRLRESISSTIGKVEARAGNVLKTEQTYTMGKELIRVRDDIDRLEDQLKMAEQRYWNQFNAMEKMMQNLNNQSNQLLSYLGVSQQK